MSESLARKRVKKVTAYNNVKEIVEKRGHKRIINGEEFRGHSLSETKLNAKLAQWKGTGEFVSPYSVGIRTDHLMALVELGINKAHHLGREVKPTIKRIMEKATDRKFKNRWERFEKTKRGKNYSDPTDRIYGNYLALRRLCKDKRGRVGEGGKSPYGMRLWQMGCCIDIFTIKHEVETSRDHIEVAVERYIRLNTHSKDPLSMEVTSRNKIPPVNTNAPTLGPQLK